MKIKFIAAMVQNHRRLLPALAVTGNILFSPFAAATVYNSTVVNDNTPLVDGDSVVISGSNINGVRAQTDALDLGNGKIDLDLSTSSSSSFTGILLYNYHNNNLGNGTSITINQTTTGDKGRFITGIYLADESSLQATGLDLKIDSTTNAVGIDDWVNTAPTVIDLGDSSKIEVSSTRSSAIGIRILGGSSLKANGLDIHVVSESSDAGVALANGILLSSGGDIDLGSGSKITAEAVNRPSSAGSAISLYNDSTLKADSLTLKGVNANGLSIHGTSSDIDLGQNSIIITEGDRAIGIYANNQNANFFADRLTVTTDGFLAHGLSIGQGSRSIDLGSGSTVITAGDYSVGINQLTSTAELEADGLTVHTKGQNSNAVEITSGKATIGSNSILSAEKSGALLVGSAGTAELTGTKMISEGTFAAKVEGLATFNNSEAQASGSADYALWVNGTSGRASLTNQKIFTDGTATGLYVSNGGSAYLYGDTVINAQSGIAVLTDGSNSSLSTLATGKATITGRLVAENSGRLSMAMASGSYLNGAVNRYSGGSINLSMDDSYWTFDSDSDLTSLMLANDSRIVFNTASHGTLTTNSVSGNGLFHMRTDIAGGVGDLIDVTSTTAGSHLLQIVNRGGSATDGTETLVVVQTADGNGHFDLTNDVEAGGYLYGLRQTGTDWELYATGRISLPADASVSFLNAGYLMNYAEMQTLYQRMGDLRQGAENGNVWVRTYYGNFDSFRGGKLSGFDMTYNGVEIGGDSASATERGQLYTGAFVGLVDANQRYSHGHGKLQSKSIGLYAAHMYHSGAYIDAVLKYQHYRNKLSVYDSLGAEVNGRGSSHGVTASLESGHRFYYDDSRSGVYLEPQVQLTYGWQDRATVKNSNGLKVNLDSYHSLLGRAGLLLGYEVNEAGKAPVSFYFKNSRLHEFNGNTGYALNGAKESHSFKGGAWVSGVGASVKVHSKHVAYLDMEHTNGKRFEQNQINVGYRYSF